MRETMKKENITSVNGQLYDSTTGLPLTKSDQPRNVSATVAPRAQSDTRAARMHAPIQRSTTLRRTNKAPVHANGITPKKRRPSPGSMDIAKNPHVNKFSQPATAAPVAPTSTSADIAAQHHPHQLRANQRIAQQKQAQKTTPRRSSQQIKEAEINKALATRQPDAKRPPKQKKSRSKHTKLIRLSCLAGAILVIILVVIWMNLPSIWIKFSSAQAGFDASFPQFTPDGYSLQLPIESANNRVDITFSSNQNDASFILTQEKSSWDSQAVRTSVEAKSNGQFLTTNDRGLTVYTYDGSAEWVNKGIHYSLSGDSSLSSDAIMRIANSL